MVAFMILLFLVLIVAPLVHVLVDRSPARRTRHRVVELWLLWWVGGSGALGVLAGLQHIGPFAPEIADGIGFAHSPFQWEVGWADIAVGTIGFLSIWNRGSFLTAAVIALSILYLGDAIGHIMQLIAHGNMAPGNVWTIPTDILQPLVAIALLIAYRRTPRTP
ncbi:DUF6790 family protein [Nonomuraea sediminis]|uniref:DUF6790 family protein n=1 Tax=Nonomuraea sediminis TaxID=2835864 RepID=UPI001BDC7126|nr:DUF6790 family protein [Nonomuraea sediminis]